MRKKCLHCGSFLGKFFKKKRNQFDTAFDYAYVCRKCGKISVFDFYHDMSWSVPIQWEQVKYR